jgi:hypothetical protein
MAGRFRKAFPDTWSHARTAVEFVKYVEPALQIRKPEDWYRISKREVDWSNEDFSFLFGWSVVCLSVCSPILYYYIY